MPRYLSVGLTVMSDKITSATLAIPSLVITLTSLLYCVI